MHRKLRNCSSYNLFEGSKIPQVTFTADTTNLILMIHKRKIQIEFRKFFVKIQGVNQNYLLHVP